ncbi:MAG: protein kinase domain-containing protein [Planctomycetota bacterium]
MKISIEELIWLVDGPEGLDAAARDVDSQDLPETSQDIANCRQAILQETSSPEEPLPESRVSLDHDRLWKSPPDVCRVGRYILVKKIGQGGMGKVYLAQHQTLPEIHKAVKIIPAELGAGAGLREARTAAILADDTRIVGALDFEELADGSSAIGMDYVKGDPIDVWARQPGRHITRVICRFQQVAEAVANIHRRGYVHGDLKPEHILVTANDDIRILDFGVSVSPDKSRSSCPGCTKPWASPQRMAGAAPTPADDVYSLGRMIHDLFDTVGTSSFDYSAIRSPLMCWEVGRITRKCLARCVGAAERSRGTTHRYVNAAELSADLQAVLERRPINAVRPWPGYSSVCLIRRQFLVVCLLMIVVTAGVLLSNLRAVRGQVQALAENRLRDQNTFKELASQEAKAVRHSILEEVRESIASLPDGDSRNDLLVIISKLEGAALAFETGHSELALSRLRQLLQSIHQFPAQVRSHRGWKVIRFAVAIYLADRLFETVGHTGEAEEAVRVAQDALGSDQDPEFRPFHADLLDRRGRIATGRFDFLEADHLYEQAEALRMQLPPETPWRCLNLAISRLHRSDLRSRPNGGLYNVAMARGWLIEARELIDREVARGRSVEIARAVILERLGQLTLNHDGKEGLERAREYFRGAETAYRYLLTLDPDSPEFTLRLAIVLQFCGDVSLDQGSFKHANKTYLEAMDLLNRPLWSGGRHVGRLECIGCLLRRRLVILQSTGASNEALQSALQVVSLYRSLYASTHSLSHVEDLANSLALAAFLLSDSLPEQAVCLLSEGIALLKQHGAAISEEGRLDELLRKLVEDMGTL